MMSARQYAEKYPGQLVKIASDVAKGYGLKPNTPLGIIVGFRPGTNGIVGSSKVAIWRDNYLPIASLARNNISYSPIVYNPPDRKLGIYFLSVNEIELLEPPKQINVYPNKCKYCHSPARAGSRFVICSKFSCKTNRIVLKALGPFLKIRTVDKNGFLLCPYCQSDKVSCNNYDYKQLTCFLGHKWNHPWKHGEKIISSGMILIWDKEKGLQRTKR